MGDFLSTGLSGLFAFKRAIDVTSHNIANVGTDGYSRQRAEFVTREATRVGNGYVGNGVSVATTTRSYDDLLAQNVRGASSSFSNLDTYTSYMEKLSNLFGNTTTGITASMSKFSSALQDVSNNPSSISARQVLLSQASALTERLKNYDSQLANLDSSVESTLKDGISDINSLAKNIAKLNEQIAGAYAQGGGQAPNDLLDQRDRLLDQLSAKVDVNTLKQEDGSVSVFIGNGQSLVVGATYAQFALSTDQYDPNRHGISLVNPGGANVDITNSIKGGTLGGALDFRNQVLDPARNTLGHIAVGLADVINDQHHAGLDLTGNLGGDFFNIGPVETRARIANGGSATVAVTRSDGSAVTEGDYFLTKTATGWSLRREDTGATVTLTGTGTVADPFKGDGLDIVVSGAANTNDSFLIRPTRQAVSGLSVAITDPAKIAAAAPIKTLAASANTGSGKISAGSVVDATDPNLRSTATIAFTSPTTYTINGAGSFTYTPGSDITVNGAKFAITGTPATGDQFTVQDNAGGTGDNRNAQALYDSLNSKALDGGTASLNDTTNRLIGNIGVLTQQAQQNRDAQKVVQDQAKGELDSISGVNLDEEAANLMRYQQAYQAAAQLIGVANTLFDSLLNATRR
jgi:flagellar hook-associated protein 1 FlgK